MKNQNIFAGISLLLASTAISLGEEPGTLIELGTTGSLVLLFLGLSAWRGKKTVTKK